MDLFSQTEREREDSVPKLVKKKLNPMSIFLIGTMLKS